MNLVSQFIKMKYVLLDFYGNEQSSLECLFKNYGQFRNYYNVHSNETLAALFMLADLAAKSINATTIAVGHPSFKKDWNNPRVLPFLQYLDADGRTIGDTWNAFYTRVIRENGKSVEVPEYISLPLMNFNFVYCAIPNRKWDSVWDLGFIFDPFDLWAWVAILISFLFVGLIAFWNVSERKFSFEYLSSLEVLICPGSSGVPENSILFLIWMLVCQLIVYFYTGQITGEVISPPPEERLTTIDQLKQNNYSLIFPSIHWQKVVQFTALAQVKQGFVSKDISTLWEILNKNEMRSFKTNDDFILELSGSNLKLASVVTWPYTTWAATTSNNYIVSKAKSSNQKIDRKCYIGRELITPSADVLLAFTPPESYLMAKFFRRLIASGIVYRWMDEYAAVLYSRRVQDRIKVISPTNILDESIITVESLELEGKTVTIFLQWMCCLVCCFICLSVEIVSRLINTKTKIIYF